MRFDGRVIDGPYEGKQYAFDCPRFQIAMCEPGGITWIKHPGDPPSISIGWYIWSYSLRAWCFEGVHG